MNHTLEYWLRWAVQSEADALRYDTFARRAKTPGAVAIAEKWRDKRRSEAVLCFKCALDCEANERAAERAASALTDPT